MRAMPRMYPVLASFFLIFTYTTYSCLQKSLCRDAGNFSSVCRFERYPQANCTADVLFDVPIENIQNLRLEFNPDGYFVFSQFPFTDFFQLGFRLLRDLYIISDTNIIEEKTSIFRMDELHVLPHLSKFSFHVKNAKIVPANMSLQLRLRHLDVSYSTDINLDQLCKIVKFSGPALEEVYAEGINGGDLDKFKGTLDDAFFSCFQNTLLQILYLPDSNIKILASPNLNLYVPSLQILDVSRNHVLINKDSFYAVFKLNKLKKLIISDVPFPKSYRDTNCEYDKGNFSRGNYLLCDYFPHGSTAYQLQNLEVIDIGGSTDCHKLNAFYCADTSQCIFPHKNGLRELYLDHICIIRFDMLFGGLNRLDKLDFSSNLCEYISSLVFSSMLSLRTLLLNGNSLSKMEESDPEELRILFRENRNLQYLNLSANGFSQLPSDIFATNIKLEVLDVSKNFLLNTDWLTSALVHLHLVNITENQIMTLDTRTRQVIEDSAYGYNYSSVQVDGIHLTLASNPISCSCDQEDMLHWLSNNKRYIIDIDRIVCAEAGPFISTYTDDIDSYRHMCEFQRYKSLFALCTIPIIATICVVLYLRHYRHILRIRRIRKQLDEFVEDNFRVQKRFLLYLAYSFSDSDMVLNTIFPELESRLQKEVGVNGKLVCISDRDFDVGVSIADEIINAVSSSSAVLFILSKEFARSHWCEFEAEIALYQGKPIILVTLGQVKIRSLPTSLRKVCFKWTRLEWPGTKNQDKLEGFWKKLVTAVIKYTADAALVNETQL